MKSQIFLHIKNNNQKIFGLEIEDFEEKISKD